MEKISTPASMERNVGRNELQTVKSFIVVNAMPLRVTWTRPTRDDTVSILRQPSVAGVVVMGPLEKTNPSVPTEASANRRKALKRSKCGGFVFGLPSFGIHPNGFSRFVFQALYL
jgi:hypothetical protein